MKRTTQLFAMLATLLCGFAGSALAAAPEYVRVRSITYNGSGCPLGSVAQNVSSDRQAFTLIFDRFIAEAGPGVPYAEKRKNCQVNVDLDFPQGWTYTIASFDYRGYADMQAGVKGLQKSSYYFQGQGATASLETPFYGPTSRDYTLSDTLGLSALVWAPCGAHRSLNINAQVRIDNSRNPNGSGILTTDSIDGEFKTVYRLRWERCR